MRIALYGAAGKVGAVLLPALERGGHEVVDGREAGPEGCDVAVDFTRPDAVLTNAEQCFAAGIRWWWGRRGSTPSASTPARARPVCPCFYAPNFAIGAVLMMRFAEQAAAAFPRAEIVEMHDAAKVDAPSGTAKATADRMGGDVPIHSIRLPGLVAHQEVIFGGPGETLTIRHDTTSREAFSPACSARSKR